MERNLRITIAFDGAKFHGWQIQKNAYSVQECFQTALFAIVGTAVTLKACSRTDTGVHARRFCISVRLTSPIPCDRLLCALNHFLPKTIAALSVEDMPLDFHARYDCLGKEYVYEIWNHPLRDPFLENRALHYWHPLNEKRLNAAATHYLGTHNFAAFCTMDARKKGDLVRTVSKSTVERSGDMVRFIIRADGFLYNMVRIMVGTLLRVEEKRIDPATLPQILLSKDRMQAGPTAPPHGLYLNHVFYSQTDIERV